MSDTPGPWRSDLAERAALRRVLNQVLLIPCKAHGAAPHEPCWVIPSDSPGSIAVCDARVRRARQRPAVLKRRAEKRSE